MPIEIVESVLNVSDQRRLCYFCGQPGPMSKEHAWPQWMKAGAEVRSSRTTTDIGFGRTSDDAFGEMANVRRDRQGSVLTIKVREVCAKCNSGWMSELEVAARPVLHRLWLGLLTKLTTSEIATIAAWSLKTSWMHERAHHQKPTALPQQRLALAGGRLVSHTRVWAACHQGGIDFACPIARVSTVRHGDGWDSQHRRHVMIAAIVCHGVALLVRTDNGAGVPKMSLDQGTWLPLTPRSSRGRLAWPPRGRVSDDDIRRRLTVHTDWVLLPDVPRFERDNRGWTERFPEGRGS
jgi:hypothetical protein